MSPDVYGKLMVGMAIAPAEMESLRELVALLISMNAGKQAGFYTDFDLDSGSWTAPDTVSRTEFDRARVLIGEYVGETQRQIDDFGPLQGAAGPAARARPAKAASPPGAQLGYMLTRNRRAMGGPTAALRMDAPPPLEPPPPGVAASQPPGGNQRCIHQTRCQRRRGLVGMVG
jgi:hypothetical protein